MTSIFGPDAIDLGGKAIAGGETSEVNNKFYKGGQYMPITGKYCGKGKTKMTVEQFAEVSAAADKKGLKIEFNETTGGWDIFRLVTFQVGVKELSPLFLNLRSYSTVAKVCS